MDRLLDALSARHHLTSPFNANKKGSHAIRSSIFFFPPYYDLRDGSPATVECGLAVVRTGKVNVPCATRNVFEGLPVQRLGDGQAPTPS